jgi:AAA+ ATPase superfamily predicted ATPase
MNEIFIGRKNELKALNNLLHRQSTSLVVVKGRRRIGKSQLINKFAEGKTFYQFTGLPPNKKGITAQMQRDEFSRQMGEQFKLSGIKANDWGDLFTLVARYVENEPAVILLDEISWMGSKDKNFLGKLKIVWDTHFSKNPNLILVLCGSVSTWIEKNIINSTGFFGRIALKITLEELSLSECNNLLEKSGFKWSSLEKFMILAVTGGIPWYLKLINPKTTAADNIKTLCFSKDGLFVDEYKYIFNDLFGKRKKICGRIVECLSKHPLDQSEIANELGYSNSGALSDYLEDLVISGFIRRDFVWDIRRGNETKISHYRLRDNYLHFYLKYISPHLNKIKKNQLQDIALSSLPGWDSVIGLQFEKIVLNNRHLIYKSLGIRAEDIVADNPYLQRKTTPGCQIDYLIQTKYKNLILCEIKFSRQQITNSVILEVKSKINSLSIPRGYAICPVLIYIGDLQDSVIDANFFVDCIDFSRFIEQE